MADDHARCAHMYDELRARVIAQNAAAPIRAVLEAAIRAAVDVTPELETPEAALLACEETLYDALMHGLD